MQIEFLIVVFVYYYCKYYNNLVINIMVKSCEYFVNKIFKTSLNIFVKTTINTFLFCMGLGDE